jgi:hypothetical protein
MPSGGDPDPCWIEVARLMDRAASQCGTDDALLQATYHLHDALGARLPRRDNSDGVIRRSRVLFIKLPPKGIRTQVAEWLGVSRWVRTTRSKGTSPTCHSRWKLHDSGAILNRFWEQLAA